MELSVKLLKDDCEANVSEVTVTGACPGLAQNRPLFREELEKRLRKTGDTPFEVAELDIDLEDGLFVPVGQLNELRRSALEQLQNKLLEQKRRKAPEKQTEHPYQLKNAASGTENGKPLLNVWISSTKYLSMLLHNPSVGMITLEDYGTEHNLVEQIHQAGKQAGYAFPYVLRENSEQLLQKAAADMQAFDRIWVRSYDGIGFAKETLGIPAKKLALDAGLYVFSNEAAADFLKDGFAGYTASQELNSKELAHMKNEQAELMIYGYAPLMISAQCVYKNYASCIKEKHGAGAQNERLYLNDRYHKQFEVVRNCRHCYNVIYNSQPTSLLHQAKTIRKLDFASYRIVFRNESEGQRMEILNQYADAFVGGKEVSAPKEGTFTNGHFRRGVD